MHELGLCECVVEAAVRRADGRRVSALKVRVGGHPVDPGVIEQGVQVAALGTVVEGARVDVVSDPAKARCRDCGAEAPVTDAMALTACASCGGVDVEVTGTEHAVLESLSFLQHQERTEWTPSNC